MKLHAAAVADAEVGVPWHRVARRRVRTRTLVVERRLSWLVRAGAYRTTLEADPAAHPVLLRESRCAIERADDGAEPVFEAGKRVNVALAAPAFDFVQLEPGRAFSFWRTLGRPSAALGFRYGMEIRGGCVVPSLGGGLCLLSNALFRLAAELGWDLLERHGHTVEAVPSDATPWGVDATVAWPHVDLRFAVPLLDPPACLRARVDGDDLVLQVWSAATTTRRVELAAIDDRVEIVGGQQIRRNRIERRMTAADGTETVEVIGENAKRLLRPTEVGRSCLTCGLESCAGRVTIR